MSDAMIQEELSPAEFREIGAAIESQVGQVIVGQHNVVRHVLMAIIGGGHALLEGVPGLGKTMLIRTLSDELGKSIGVLDAALKKLNLGISTWSRLDRWEDAFGNYSSRYLGYAKVNNRWGIALRTVAGNNNQPEEATVEEWLFNDAPRALRIEAVE